VKTLCLAVAAFAAISTTAVGEPIEPTDISVIDGDTIRVYQMQPNVRLIGFDTPETRRAACDTERKLGSVATHRLREIVRAGNLDFQYLACSCSAGTQGTPSCNFGRD
jgi:endonuclease YncB( thermonuclease family)